MKHIKFIKNHPSGNFHEGDHVEVVTGAFDAWTNSEYAEAVTKKEYDTHVKETAERLKAETKEARQAQQDKIDKISGKNKKSEKVSTVDVSGSDEGSDKGDLGNDKGTGSDNGNDSSNGAEKKYHSLTQEDLEANEIYCEGLEVGTEVEIDDEGLFPLNDQEQMIVKPTE